MNKIHTKESASNSYTSNDNTGDDDNRNKNKSRDRKDRRRHKSNRDRDKKSRDNRVRNYRKDNNSPKSASKERKISPQKKAHLEIIPLGGFSEVGRNSVAIKADDEIVILDLGLMMDRYIEYTDSDELVELSGRKLIEIGAVPDVNILGADKKNVKGILLTHAHLDHIGAVPFLANRFDCDIHSAPFTIELIKKMFEDEKRLPRGHLVAHDLNERFKISEKIEAEFINITHSIPHAVMIVIHTPYGKVLYANDFKFDNNPTLGPKPNYQRLRELEGKIDYLILDTLYAEQPIKTPSEKIAEEMLKDVLLGTQSRDSTIIVTTFSSHIARLRAIANLGKMMKRKVVLLGRSLRKYVEAAETVGIADFSDVEIIGYGNKIKPYLKKVKNPEKYLFVATGNQGEPKATLSRIVEQKMLPLSDNDEVIFSCKMIPVPVTIKNRGVLEGKLRALHVRIFTDIHVSGHGAREDERDFLNMLKPKNIIPTHGEVSALKAFKELAKEVGYKDEQIHILKNGERVRVA